MHYLLLPLRARPSRVLVVASVVLAFALVVGACTSDDDTEDGTPDTGAPTPRAPQSPDEPAPAELGSDVETVATGLEVPWALGFVDDDTMLVTERPGRVRAISNGRLADEPVGEVSVSARGEGGLLGLAVHPDDPFVYLYYTAAGENKVSRYEIEGAGADLRLGAEQTILDGIPASDFHNGGRVRFGPDGLLYVTTGDAGDPGLAPDTDSLGGKILRIAPDGSVPDDNPFGNEVWSYGHRNVQGIAWDQDGNMYASEHGPTGEFGLCCLDELNLVEEGSFYGWPFQAGDQDAGDVGDPPEDTVAPLAHSGPDGTWAPSGIEVVETPGGDTVVMANLAGEHLRRFDLGASPERIRNEEVVVEGLGRLRDAVAGPDGCVYVLTSNRDGRGSPADDDDRLLRLCPEE